MTTDLSAEAIMRDLVTRFVGQKTLYFEQLPSTMDTARQEALRNTPEGTAIVTGEQTAGRGRLNRAWLTPAGNIALSVVLYPDKQRLPSLPMVAGLAVIHAIEMVTGLKPELKWPNDILLNSRKVGGILIETGSRSDRTGYAVIGIGINARLTPADFPDIESSATGLFHEAGGNVSRIELARYLLRELEQFYLASSDGDAVFLEWRSRLVTLGKQVRVTASPDESTFEAVAESVNPDGSLQLRHPDGTLTSVFAGDVTLSTKTK